MKTAKLPIKAFYVPGRGRPNDMYGVLPALRNIIMHDPEYQRSSKLIF